MKGLKKLALASAIAAAPFAAQAELKALDDGAMGNVTGQAGVTIELETKVDVGEFRYVDEGSFAVSGIHIGGGNVVTDADGNVTGVDGLLDDLKIDIDVEADGDAVIHVGNVNGQVPIDFAVGIESASLRAQGVSAADATDSNSTLLASNIGIVGNLAQLDIRVDTETDHLITDVSFNITNMDMDIDFLGVNIRGMQVMGANFFEESAAGGGLTPAGMFAAAQITISKATGTGSANGDALQIEVPQFVTDINVAATEIGGSSIGTIQLDNLAITQTNMKVYGHE
ncbi:hypothetical protein RE428_26440 [Marinobacter nanhaiticus D15-8W]|uniref:DUF6160 domain-containing protein n=1 Tax=Marinobacter nanhaiticus D15-8W TaxID=626887 RepID=N6W2C2_9GAMM|nr:DUF6160 family protein [Marinobacter nanhaiticus]ENO14239.1 hypothetical protein J057_22635 [Marinobacter nanhaiticus D15-8W]BES71626.1 hypothetical protein RE428_26440 [Marinobacter nanhaiticus D15-8W]